MISNRIFFWPVVGLLLCWAAPARASDADAMASALRQDLSVRFVSPDKAELVWETHEKSSATVLWGEGPQWLDRRRSEVRRIDSPSARQHHVELSELAPRTDYSYQVVITIDGRELRSEINTFDTTFNYTVPTLLKQKQLEPAQTQLEQRRTIDESLAADAELTEKARCILDAADARAGYCVVAGSATHALGLELARQSDLIVTLLETDPTQVAASRTWLFERGAYGSRVTVLPVEENTRLPLRENFANLVVIDDTNFDTTSLKQKQLEPAQTQLEQKRDELMRVLRPGSSAVFTSGRRSGVSQQTLLDSLDVKARDVGNLSVVDKPQLTGIGRWTHQYGDAANRASSAETLAGADRTGDLEVQWLGRPGGDFGLDRNPRMPAPVSSDGRLFHQGMNRIIALDAYNGAVLWNLEIPSLRRVNIPRDCGNWCLGDGRLFCVVRNQLWQIDPQTGQIEKSMQLPESASVAHTWGYVACDGQRVIGSSVPSGGVYTEYWSGARWYDKQVPEATSMVCSDSLFACDPDKDQPTWTYHGIAIINPTITVDHGRVYFAENRSEQPVIVNPRRAVGEELWQDLYLVALDAATGKKVWERPLDTEPAKVVFFGQSDPQGVILATSADNVYRIDRFRPDDGTLLWHAEHQWPSDNHSGHMQHPVIVGDSIYLEPQGYQLADGKPLATMMGRHDGCHTYLASSGALIYRGNGRRISMYSLDDGAISSWPALRPSCWLSVIPAGGMLLVPEGGGGCSCGRWLETSIGFAPWAAAEDKIQTIGGDR